MKIISTIDQFQNWRKEINKSVGFVPTMGAIHDGHLSLVQKSIKHCHKTVVSIYLNPIQFAPDEDLNKYPKNLEQDINFLSNYNIDAIFLPNDLEMYPPEYSTFILNTGLTKVLEGRSRPNFFQGVTTIVAKLFNIVKPSHAFFGEKDAQQLRVIQQMVADLNFPINIVSCPIVREKNGLALSSRNQYLTSNEVILASTIYSALKEGKNLLNNGEKNAKIIRNQINKKISSEPLLLVDYVSIANFITLEEIITDIKSDALISVAVYIRNVRLIDNIIYYIK